MSKKSLPPNDPIHMLFELDRQDNPFLYDDLIRFRKGTKRVNRLRTLAQQGLIIEQRILASESQSIELQKIGGNQFPDAGISNQIFDEGISG